MSTDFKPGPVKITGTFIVNAGATQEVELPDISSLSIEEIAGLVEARAPGVGLCHQCSSEIDDPELGDLTAMSIGDKYYERHDDDSWHEVSEP